MAGRALRKEDGDLTGPEHAYALPGGGELMLSVGDQVLLRVNDYRGKRTRGENEDVLNGYRGIVRAVDEERRVLVEWREKTADGHRHVVEWVDADYVAQGGLSLGYAITGQEQLDRAVAGLVREVETGTEERMILTEMPKSAVPAHVRPVVADLPTPRAPGVAEPNDADASGGDTASGNRSIPATAEQRARPITPPEPEPMADRPYAHLSNSALRDAVRRAATAARATSAAAERAEAAAQRAEQQAAAGAGAYSLALSRRHQGTAERAVAIRELRALGGAVTERADRLHDTQARIDGLDQQLTETGRFGRPVLRGEDRTVVEADREELLRTREEAARQLKQMNTRLNVVTQQAGPVGEHEAVLTEADMPQEEKAALFRRAQKKDNQAASRSGPKPSRRATRPTVRPSAQRAFEAKQRRVAA